MTIDLLKKEIYYRGQRRGTKELDMYLQPFIHNELDNLEESELIELRDLLLEFEDDLHAWFTGAVPVPQKYKAMIDRIRNSKK